MIRSGACYNIACEFILYTSTGKESEFDVKVMLNEAESGIALCYSHKQQSLVKCVNTSFG